MLTLLLFASKVTAREISYDYAQFSFISDTINPAESAEKIEGSGIGLAISLGFSPSFAMTLAVASTSFDSFQGIDVETSKTTILGVTAHTSVFSNTSVFTNASLIKAEFTAVSGVESISDSDIGGVAAFGLRHLFSDIVELELRAAYTVVFDEELKAGAVDVRVYVWKGATVGLGYVGSDDANALLLNARMDI